jgi:hypothetical protein
MEYIYRQVFDGALVDLQASLNNLLASFQTGDYAVSTSPFTLETYQVTGNHIAYTKTDGLGVWPVAETASVEYPNQAQASFNWQNEYYAAEIDASGLVRMGESDFGVLTVRQEEGDTYSEEGSQVLGTLAPVTPLALLEKSKWHAVVGFNAAWEQGDRIVTAQVKVHFDRSPILRWSVDLDSTGTDLRVDLEFETGHTGALHAGMPFDIVRRGGADTDLLPAHIEGDLGSILLGQRELNAVHTFPFQDFLAFSSGERTAAIFARGLRAYTIDGPGKLRLPLRRSVEWLTRSNLQDRVGDAGPFFYVPDARCERSECHELGFALGNFSPDSIELVALNEAFHNPPLIVKAEGRGQQSAWQFWQENLPLSSIRVQDGRVQARMFNPTGQPQRLSQTYPGLDLWGQPDGEIDLIAPKKIVLVEIDSQALSPAQTSGRAVQLNPPAWRVGQSASRPDPAVLEQLGEQIAALERELAQVQDHLASTEGAQGLRLQHRAYVLERELVEHLFSRLLNERKLSRSGRPTEQDLFQPDPEIARLGLRLNKLRIKRRIFDYVVGVL